MKDLRKPLVGLTPGEASALFTGHLEMAWMHAGKFAARYGLHYAEVKDEAEGALGLIVGMWDSLKTEHAAWKYDPKLCSPTSWIYRALYYHLLTYATRKQPREVSMFAGDGDDNFDRGVLCNTAIPAPERWVDKVLRSVGTDARIVITTILFGPAEMLEEFMPTGRAVRRRDVMPTIESWLDWPTGRLAAAWEEVNEAL